MTFIPPLELETWIINVFSGNLNIFLGVSLLFLIGLAAFFRMTGLILFFIITFFFVIFHQWIPTEMYFLLIAITSVLIGYWISQLIKR